MTWLVERIGDKNVCIVSHGVHHHFVTLQDAEKNKWEPNNCEMYS